MGTAPFNPDRQRGEKKVAFDERIETSIAALDRDARGAIVLPLEYPIMRYAGPAHAPEEIPIEALTLRRPVGADARAIDVSDTGSAIMLLRLERLSGLTAKEIDRIDEADIKRATMVMLNFT